MLNFHEEEEEQVAAPDVARSHCIMYPTLFSEPAHVAPRFVWSSGDWSRNRWARRLDVTEPMVPASTMVWPEWRKDR